MMDGRPIGDILEKHRLLGRLTEDGKFIREKKSKGDCPHWR
jgi:hypothetical protein